MPGWSGRFILSLATRDLHFSLRGLAKPVQLAVEEFQRRWAVVLGLSGPGTGPIRVRSAEIADRVAEQFPARPAPWRIAIQHSPDLMLAATSQNAVKRGEFRFVLGELHVSFNTLESRLFVEQHDDPASLVAAAGADLGERRVLRDTAEGLAGGEFPGLAAVRAARTWQFRYWTPASAESID